MKILGIDPGLATIGFGIIELVGRNWALRDVGVITTDKDTEHGERLLQIYEDIHELIEKEEPDIVAIEELFFMQNVTTGMIVSEARGVLLLAFAEHKLPVYEYAPNQVKLSITGYGMADKSQVQTMVKELLNLQSIPRPDDAADALAIALTCGFDIVHL